MNGRTQCHHLVRVNALMGLFSENSFNPLMDCRHTNHTTHQDDFIDVPSGQAGVFERGPAWRFQLVQQIGNQALKLGPGNFNVQVLGTTGIRGNERQVYIGLHGRGEFHLGFFRRFFEPLQGHLVSSQVDALIFLKFICQKIDEPQIEVLTTQMGVTVGGLDFKYAFTDLQN